MSTLRAMLPQSLRKTAPFGVISACIFLAFLVASTLVPWLVAGQSPLTTDVAVSLNGPSFAHPFGTDQAGRDVFARVIYGTGYSLLVGLGASSIALVLGTAIGVTSGLSPRLVDGTLSRGIEMLMAFPEFLLALVVIAVIGPGEGSVVVAVALSATPAYARVARVQTMVVSRAGFVRAARVLGVPPFARILRHVVPNTLGPLLVMATIGVGTAIVTAAGLSFLGLGPEPPTPEWGVILSEGRNFLATAWWIAVFPGLMITATVVATSTLGRYLRTRSGGRVE